MNELYIKCPVCFWIGGGGIVARFIVESTHSIFYACDQCESAWSEGEPISLSHYDVITGVLLKNGVNLQDHKNAFEEFFDDKEFILKGDSLREMLHSAMSSENKVVLPDPLYPYIWVVDFGYPVGLNGQTKIALIMNRAETYILDAHPIF